MNPVALVLILALIALQASAGSGSIDGMVVKAGTVLQQPLENARLELTDGPGTPLVARTDSGGTFLFSGLAPGRYRLSVTRDGFLRQEYPKPIVVARGEQIREIVFRLDPAPTVTGWVQDEYGEATANVLVEALRRSYDARGNPTLTVAASAITDDRGEYRIFWLDPGEYFFYAGPPAPETGEASPARTVAPTYFPGVADPADAKAIRLDIGREVHGADFRLRPAALTPVRGYITNAVTGRPVGATIALTRPAEDPSLSRYRAQSVAVGPHAGEFALSEPVAPGSYILSAKSTSGEVISAFQRIQIRALLGIVPPYDVRLALSPPLAVSGRLVVDSGAGAGVDLRETKISLTSLDAALPSPATVRTQPDGQFRLNAVLPGTYTLAVSQLLDDFYVKAARFGLTDALEKPLTMERDSGASLQIVLGSDGGRLHVAVFDRKNQLHKGSQVVLVPDLARRYRPDQYCVATAGEDGQVSFRGIPPGLYKIFAWESAEPNAYLNTDYVRGYDDTGVPVRVAPGENDPISVRLIPKEF